MGTLRPCCAVVINRLGCSGVSCIDRRASDQEMKIRRTGAREMRIRVEEIVRARRGGGLRFDEVVVMSARAAGHCVGWRPTCLVEKDVVPQSQYERAAPAKK